SITIGGTAGLTGSFSSGAVAINGTYAQPISSTSGGNSVSANLIAASSLGASSLLLTLTDLTFTTNSATPVTLTVHIVQQYTISAGAISATASHQINGNTSGTMGSARVQQPSTHNSTALLSLDTGVITTVTAFNA